MGSGCGFRFSLTIDSFNTIISIPNSTNSNKVRIESPSHSPIAPPISEKKLPVWNKIRLHYWHLYKINLWEVFNYSRTSAPNTYPFGLMEHISDYPINLKADLQFTILITLSVYVSCRPRYIIALVWSIISATWLTKLQTCPFKTKLTNYRPAS